jgi:hypothetical protein
LIDDKRGRSRNDFDEILLCALSPNISKNKIIKKDKISLKRNNLLHAYSYTYYTLIYFLH